MQLKNACVSFSNPDITWWENISFLFHVVSGQCAKLLDQSQVPAITHKNCKAQNPDAEMLTRGSTCDLTELLITTCNFKNFLLELKFHILTLSSLYKWVKTHLKSTCIYERNGELCFQVPQLLSIHTSTFKMTKFSLMQSFP